jgi:hypothetical protein
MHWIEGRVGRFLLFCITLGVLSGCGINRPIHGVEWVVEQNIERERLEAQGFPQYTGVN